ncbi:MAG: DUF1961 family protein [Armatimonadetes bacterium]|nr:DUF1961 family protein [Armatimonadota bacterium]
MNANENVVLFEDFSGEWNPETGKWWVEGGEKVWVEDGRLHMKADPEAPDDPRYVATVWCRQPISGDVRIEYDAHVISSSTGVNNINFFFFYSDPAGASLYSTRADRADAAYKKYHVLRGNIVTFLRDVRHGPEGTPRNELPGRVRIRHCPGFELLGETYAYHCNEGVTYHCEIVRRGTKISFSVDGNLLLEVEEPQPPSSGLIGLRTFRTWLWWDNIKVTAL